MGGEGRKSRIGRREIDDSSRPRISMRPSGRATLPTHEDTPSSSQGIIDPAQRRFNDPHSQEKSAQTFPASSIFDFRSIRSHFHSVLLVAPNRSRETFHGDRENCSFVPCLSVSFFSFFLSRWTGNLERSDRMEIG